MITVETASKEELKSIVYENDHAGLLFKAAALTELMRRGEDHAETELEGLFRTGS